MTQEQIELLFTAIDDIVERLHNIEIRLQEQKEEALKEKYDKAMERSGR